MRTTLTESIKKQVAGRQSFKCANHPDSKLINYKCPLWARGGDNSGCFDESGYEIDHIKEHAIRSVALRLQRARQARFMDDGTSDIHDGCP